MKVSKKAVFGIFLCSKLIFETKNARNNKSQRSFLADVSPKSYFCQRFMTMEWQILQYEQKKRFLCNRSFNFLQKIVLFH